MVVKLVWPTISNYPGCLVVMPAPVYLLPRVRVASLEREVLLDLMVLL